MHASKFNADQPLRALATAVYGRIPGAQFTNRSDVGGIWEVPCDKEVNMTFIFAGQKIPIHPLDTTIDLNVTNDSGDKVCLGSVSIFSLYPRISHAHKLGSFNLSPLRKMTTTISYSEWLSVRILDCYLPLCFAHRVLVQFETFICS